MATIKLTRPIQEFAKRNWDNLKNRQCPFCGSSLRHKDYGMVCVRYEHNISKRKNSSACGFIINKLRYRDLGGKLEEYELKDPIFWSEEQKTDNAYRDRVLLEERKITRRAKNLRWNIKQFNKKKKDMHVIDEETIINGDMTINLMIAKVDFLLRPDGMKKVYVVSEIVYLKQVPQKYRPLKFHSIVEAMIKYNSLKIFYAGNKKEIS